MQSLENDLEEKSLFLLTHAFYVRMSCVTTAYLLVLSVNGIANIFYLVRANSTVVMLSLEYTRDRTSSNDSTFNQNVFESGTGEPLANCSKESTNRMKRSHP